MRLLILGINFAPEPTGIGKYTGELAQWLARRGHQISVVTTRPYYPEWKRAPGWSGWTWRSESWEGCTEFPWPHIRSALCDLVRIGQAMEPDVVMPGSDRQSPFLSHQEGCWVRVSKGSTASLGCPDIQRQADDREGGMRKRL